MQTKQFFIKTTSEQTGKGDQSNTINFESISQGKKSKIPVDRQQVWFLSPPLPPLETEGRWQVDRILGNTVNITSFIDNALVGKALHISLSLAESGRATESYYFLVTRLC